MKLLLRRIKSENLTLIGHENFSQLTCVPCFSIWNGIEPNVDNETKRRGRVRGEGGEGTHRATGAGGGRHDECVDATFAYVGRTHARTDARNRVSRSSEG